MLFEKKENSCDTVCRAVEKATASFAYESSLIYDSVIINQQLQIYFSGEEIQRNQLSSVFLSKLNNLVRFDLQKLLKYNSKEAISAAFAISKLGVAYSKWNFDALISSGIPTQDLQQVQNSLINQFNNAIDLIFEAIDKCDSKKSNSKCCFRNLSIGHH